MLHVGRLLLSTFVRLVVEKSHTTFVHTQRRYHSFYGKPGNPPILCSARFTVRFVASEIGDPRNTLVPYIGNHARCTMSCHQCCCTEPQGVNSLNRIRGEINLLVLLRSHSTRPILACNPSLFSTRLSEATSDKNSGDLEALIRIRTNLDEPGGNRSMYFLQPLTLFEPAWSTGTLSFL